MAVENVREYVSALERELRFDPALARRLCAEVEDHLLESALKCGEREAVSRFGAPEAIAAQAAGISFHRRTRAAAASAVIVVLAMFFLMQLRLAWYGMVHWHVTAGQASTVDRWAFLLGLIAALTALACWTAWRVFAWSHTFGRARLQGSFLLSMTTAVCVLILLASDMFVTGTRIASTPWSPLLLVPALIFILECAFAAMLSWDVRRMVRSKRRASA